MPVASVGAYEAKTHLPALLARVERGETLTITRHGRPIAELRPIRESAGLTVDDAVAGLRAFRAGRSLGGLSVRDLIEDGRRL
jgi:prevent-host-death family protein